MFHVKIRAIHKKSSKPIHNIVLWIINMKSTKFPNHVIWPDGRRGGGRGKSISRTKKVGYLIVVMMMLLSIMVMTKMMTMTMMKIVCMQRKTMGGLDSPPHYKCHITALCIGQSKEEEKNDDNDDHDRGGTD